MIKATQADSFTSEMKIIQQSGSLKKSSLYRLDPFIDNYGVIRVGGRHRQADQLYISSTIMKVSIIKGDKLLMENPSSRN